MRIQYNQGLFTQNRYNQTNTELNKTLNNLSSGYKINQAADDAAGLSISEKLRAQVRGLEKAEKNIQDGVSLVKVAESGLNGTHENLQRARELVIQAANDTLTSSDRQVIQKEIEQIKDGINEIANNTEFNGINLLNMADVSHIIDETITKTISTDYTVTIPVTTIETITWNEKVTEIDKASTVIDLSKVDSITIFERTSKINEKTFKVTELVNGVLWETPETSQPIHANERYYFSVDLKNNTFTTRSINAPTYTVLNNITGVRLNGIEGYDETVAWATNLISHTNNINNPEEILGDNLTDNPYSVDATTHNAGATSDSFMTVNFEAHKKIVTNVTKSKTVETTTDITKQVTDTQVITERIRKEILNDPLILQVGANSGDNFVIDLTDARTTALKIDEIVVDPYEKIKEALGKIDGAIQKISDERSKYGTYQNALEHILNNVSNTKENLTKAESTLRDADMAKEISKLKKDQVLLQSSQSMMAQINQMSQGVLEILG